jgi:hypothetical protein
MKQSWSVSAIFALACLAGLVAWSQRHGALPAGAGAPASRLPASMAPGTPRRLATLVLPATTDASRQPATLQLTEDVLRAAVAEGTLLVDAGVGRVYPVRITRRQHAPGGAWTAIGRVETRLGPQSMVVTINGRNVFGVLPKPDGTLLSITTTRGITSITPVGGLVGGQSGLGKPDFLVPPSLQPRASGATAAAARAYIVEALDEPVEDVRIDVLGLYSDEVVALRGSVEAAEVEVASQVAVADQAFIDSGTHVRINLVGMKQVDIDLQSSNDQELLAITASLMEIDLADQLAADLVFLDTPQPEGDPTCGEGWMNFGIAADDYYSQPTYGYSVVNVAPCSPYALAHQIGHNMGSSHEVVHGSTPPGDWVTYGAFPWSFGYRIDGPDGFETIMAYDDPGTPLIGRFSSPDSNACGEPCGVPRVADNARSLDAMAQTIAGFREPPGSIVIGDGARIEPMPGETVALSIPIRAFGMAGADNLQFDVEVAGGTATLDEDYRLPTRQVSIDRGMSEVPVPVTILGDDAIEGDETIVLRIVSPNGLAIADAEATVTIVDDDPRDIVAGRVRFPEGTDPPTTSWYMDFYGVATVELGSDRYLVSPPDFAFALPVVAGSTITIDGNVPPAPFVSERRTFTANDSGTTWVDYRLRKGVPLSGKLTIPEGGADPGAVTVIMEIATPDGRFASNQRVLSAGDPFTEWVAPGSVVKIFSFGAPPYSSYKTMFAVDAPMVQDIRMSALPSLWVMVPAGLTEPRETAGLALQFLVDSSQGEVTVHWQTEDGSAKAGQDYVAASGTVVIPQWQGEGYARIDLLPDQVLDGAKYFLVRLDSPAGAVVANPLVKVVIRDDEPEGHTGGPGQKQSLP